MIKKLLILIAVGIEINSLRLFLSCRDFSGQFHFSALDMRLKLEEAIHNDVGYSTNLARAFHNKAAFTANQVLVNYLHFWDIRFGAIYFSLVGYFGIFSGFWYLAKRKGKFSRILLILLLILPFIEVFRLISEFQIRFLLLSIPYLLLSVYGLWQFIRTNKKKGLITIVILVVLSFWYQSVFSNDVFLNCDKLQ